MPVVVTTLALMKEHGAQAAVWRRLGRTGRQTLTDALDNPDGDQPHEQELAAARAGHEAHRLAEWENHRPVCADCGEKFSDDRYTYVKHHRPTRNYDHTLCTTCQERNTAATAAAAEWTARPPAPDPATTAVEAGA
ncbi:hypothetical protein JK364_51065 [Streptomyces sp. 110]|uniref:HNH endonuclease n=1 Tax=Streptomyces endocoffeicus TaxID=2898945 RepID=A0ABS1Q8W3_9ACTN|nr:hypothetical protein [Streptomyces endocoffeicus]MBL1120577.1 hypothetical protein [Streptomyces endocoffeicus]